MELRPTVEGSVKWFSTEKGFGFISVPSMEDHFFHVSHVIGPELPSTGDRVSFSPTTGRNGKPSATAVVVTQRAPPTPRRAYYGKAKYKTEVVQPAKPGETKVGTSIALGGLGLLIGGPIGGIIGAALGAYAGENKDAVPEITKQVEITSPCIRCGGKGQVTAEVGDRTGFQCPQCGNFWKVRTSTLS